MMHREESGGGRFNVVAGGAPNELPATLDQPSLAKFFRSEFWRLGVEPSGDLVDELALRCLGCENLETIGRQTLSQNLRKMVSDIHLHYLFRHKVLDGLPEARLFELRGPILIHDAQAILDSYRGLLPPF